MTDLIQSLSRQFLFVLITLSSFSLNAQRQFNVDSMLAEMNKPVFGAGQTHYVPYRKKDKWGFVNYQGKTVMEPQYDSLFFVSGGYCLAKKGDEAFLLNNTLETVLDFTRYVRIYIYQDVDEDQIPYNYVHYIPLENVFEIVLPDGRNVYAGIHSGTVLVFENLEEFRKRNMRANVMPVSYIPDSASVVREKSNFRHSNFSDSVTTTYYGRDSVSLDVYLSGTKLYDTLMKQAATVNLVGPYFVSLYHGDDQPHELMNLRTGKIINFDSGSYCETATSFDSLNYLLVNSHEYGSSTKILNENGEVVYAGDRGLYIEGPFVYDGKGERFFEFYKLPEMLPIGKMTPSGAANPWVFQNEEGYNLVYDNNGKMLLKTKKHINAITNKKGGFLLATSKKLDWKEGELYSPTGKLLMKYKNHLDVRWREVAFVIYDQANARGGIYVPEGDSIRYFIKNADFSPLNDRIGIMEFSDPDSIRITDHFGNPVDTNVYVKMNYNDHFVALKKLDGSYSYFDKELNLISNGNLTYLLELTLTDIRNIPLPSVYIFQTDDSNELYGIMDQNFKVIAEPKYTSIKASQYNRHFVVTMKNGKYGFLLPNGTELFED